MIVFMILEAPSIVFSSIDKAKAWGKRSLDFGDIVEATVIAKAIDGIAISYPVSFFDDLHETWIDDVYYIKHTDGVHKQLGLAA